MTFALSHTLSRPASSAHFSAPVKFGILPRAPGNRDTPRSCISDQTSSLISSLDIHRRQQETSVRNFVPEIPPAEADGSFNSGLGRKRPLLPESHRRKLVDRSIPAYAHDTHHLGRFPSDTFTIEPFLRSTLSWR